MGPVEVLREEMDFFFLFGFFFLFVGGAAEAMSAEEGDQIKVLEEAFGAWMVG